MTNKRSKLNNEVRTYVLGRKSKNHAISCRRLAEDASARFEIKISKSSINNILKASRLNSPVGRSVSKIFRPAMNAMGAGYCFLFGANMMLGLSKILASTIKKAHPLVRLKSDTLEAISDAWLLAKAVYNVPLGKIEDYHKNEIWLLVGRKANKGLLARYMESFKYLQTINSNIVSELQHVLQDVRFLRFHLADNSQYIIDGQFRSIWKEGPVPLDFCTTIDVADSYINSIFFVGEPAVIFNARPEAMLGEEISNFIFSLDGASSQQRIRRIELVSHKSTVIKEIPFIVPERRRFILGIWPWQYKTIAELEKKPAAGKVTIEPTESEFYFSEESVKFVQHAHNIELTLRLVIVKLSKDGPARIGFFTNLDKEQWDTKRVVEQYLRSWPNPEAGHKSFIKASKNPEYAEEFISGQKIYEIAKKIGESRDPDMIFTTLVEILNEFSKRVFFPTECAGWGLLKMRELFYKQNGHIKRDMADDVLYKLMYNNELEQKNFLDFACVKFNESRILDFSGRKLWAIPPA